MLDFAPVISTYASGCFYLLRVAQDRRLTQRSTLTRHLLGVFPTYVFGYRVRYLQRQALFLCFHDIFVRGVYRFATANPSPFIIDCGASIGIATLYFKSLYPQARIWAFEPDPETFSVLSANVKANRFRDVRLFGAAVWDTEGAVELFHPRGERDSLRMSVDPSRAGGARTTVPAKRLADMIDQPVDLLKLDIEGAEQRVLRDLASSGKLSNVGEMVIEYHHHVGNGPSRLSSFLGLLESGGFSYQISASHFPWAAHDRPQDILIRAYRR